MRRTITIVAVVIVVIGAAVGGYFIFFANHATLTATSGISNQNPFGTPGGDAATGSGSTNQSDTSVQGTNTVTQVAPHLVKITAGPVAQGFIALDPPSTAPVPVSLASTTASTTPAQPVSGTEVRYIDRESGNMYEYDADGAGVRRLTNHTIPGVEQASWLSDGSTAFLQFLTTDADSSEHIDTYALPADGSDGSMLARDLGTVAESGTSTLFTLAPTTSGSVGTLSKPDGSGAATLFSSPLSAVTAAVSGKTILIYTKPSANLSGYAFIVDRSTGSFSKILGPLPGLAALPSPSGKDVLFSYVNASGSIQLVDFDVATHTMTPLPIATLAEKCAWTADSLFIYCAVPTTLPSGQSLPDSWYQGTVAFSDRLWKIDFSARVATLVADLPQLSTQPIDAVSLTLDPNANTLVFMNKIDLSLWAYSF